MTSLLLSLTLMLLPQARRPLDDKEIERLTERSEVVVIAEVAKLEPAMMPGQWSGLISSRQFVQYEVREVLKGEVSDAKIRVGFMLLQNSLTADENWPQLSPKLFRKGNVHVLFLKRDRKSRAADEQRTPWLKWLAYDSVDSDYGAVTSSPGLTEKLRAPQAASPGTKVATPPDDRELERLTERSDIVAIAEVKEVEPTSELQPWSGLTSSWQFVRYEVKEVIKGETPEGEIRVGFMLVPNSLTADKSRPGLSPELFKNHSLHIIFLELDRQPATVGTHYTGVNQDYGAITATPAAQKKIRALRSTPNAAKVKKAL